MLEGGGGMCPPLAALNVSSLEKCIFVMLSRYNYFPMGVICSTRQVFKPRCCKDESDPIYPHCIHSSDTKMFLCSEGYMHFSDKKSTTNEN